MKIDLSRVEWMRQQAIAIQELTRGLPTPITDNALKSAIEMGNYVQELAQIIQTIQPQGDVELAEKKIKGALQELYNIEQSLGKALGYPEYTPDFNAPKGDVCIGEHTPSTIAEMAGERIKQLEKENKEFEEALTREAETNFKQDTLIMELQQNLTDAKSTIEAQKVEIKIQALSQSSATPKQGDVERQTILRNLYYKYATTQSLTTDDCLSFLDFERLLDDEKFKALQSFAKEFTAKQMIEFAVNYCSHRMTFEGAKLQLTEYRKRGGK